MLSYDKGPGCEIYSVGAGWSECASGDKEHASRHVLHALQKMHSAHSEGTIDTVTFHDMIYTESNTNFKLAYRNRLPRPWQKFVSHRLSNFNACRALTHGCVSHARVNDEPGRPLLCMDSTLLNPSCSIIIPLLIDLDSSISLEDQRQRALDSSIDAPQPTVCDR